MHRGKVDPGVSELPRGNELSRDHVNRPSVEKQVPDEQIYRFLKVQSTAAYHGSDELIDSGRVLFCNPGRPHSNTSTKQIFDNSIVIVDEGPRVDAGLALICCSCHLVDLLLTHFCK